MRPLNAVLIGTGMVARTHAAAFADQSEVRLTGVVSRDPDRAERFIDDCVAADPRPRALTLADAAADPSLDFAVVATPPSARRDIAATLASAGKPVLMEKPIERDLARATEIVEICEAAGVPLGIVLQLRMRAPVRQLRALLDEGRLGALHMVEVRVPWWRPQSYYDEPGRGTYDRDGGGVLLTQAIHTLDLMLAIAGPVDRVTAMTARTGFHRIEAEDFAVAGLAFASGAVGSLTATTASFPGQAETIALHAERASVRLEAGTLDIAWQDGATESFGTAAASGAGGDPMAFTHAWHRDILTDFAAALRAGRPPAVSGREALRVHRLIAAIERSAETGAPVATADVA